MSVETAIPLEFRRIPGRRPVPLPRPEHLQLTSWSCPRCGDDRAGLDWSPLDLGPDYPEWAGPDLGAFCGAVAGSIRTRPPRPCRRCEIGDHAGRLAPIPRPPVHDAVAEELARLRALVAGQPAEDDPTPPGSRFKFGKLIITEAACYAVGRGLANSYRQLSPGPFPHFERLDRATVASRGRDKIVNGVLVDFGAGDLGSHGHVSDGDAAKARADLPRSSWRDQAALALATGRGTVFARLDVPADYPAGPGRAVEALSIWAELHPTRGSIVLAYIGDDGVTLC